MYEMINVSEHCACIQSPARIGVVRNGQDEVCLIGSTVRSCLTWLKEAGLLQARFRDKQHLWHR